MRILYNIKIEAQIISVTFFIREVRNESELELGLCREHCCPFVDLPLLFNFRVASERYRQDTIPDGERLPYNTTDCYYATKK